MDESLSILAEYFDTSSSEILNLLNKNFDLKKLPKKIEEKNDNKNIDIVLPYYGVINYDKCKNLVFNHGLYTQCQEKCIKEDTCKKCKNNKYGTVFDRQRYDICQYITPSGKKELDYNSFIVKMNYDMNEVRRIFSKLNINYPLTISNDYNKNIEKKKRGRPCKNKNITNDIQEENVTLEVIIKEIDGVEYLMTSSSILLDNSSYEIVGMLENDKVIYY
jgi:hypothetical protein